MPLADRARKLLDVLAKQANVEGSTGPRFQLEQPGQLVQQGNIASKVETPTVRVPNDEVLSKLTPDQQAFIISNIQGKLNEGTIGTKSPLADPGFDVRKDTTFEEVAGRDYDPTSKIATDKFGIDDQGSPLRAVDKEEDILSVIRRTIEEAQEGSDITLSPNQIQSMLRDKNSTANTAQMSNIREAEMSGQDLQMPISHENTVPRTQVTEANKPLVSDRYNMVKTLMGMPDVMKAQQQFGVPSGGGNIANTGQNIQALGSMDAFRNPSGKFYSSELEDLFRNTQTTRTQGDMPQNMPSPEGRFSEDFDKFVRESGPAFKSPDQERAISAAKRKQQGSADLTQTQGQNNFSLKDDPRLVGQDEKVNDIIELLSLIKQGKFAASKQDKAIVQQLLKQETGMQERLIKELLEEGGR